MGVIIYNIRQKGAVMENIDRVREKVSQYQAQNNLSDQQMAELIGCSRPLYQRTRTGKVPLGGRFIKGALKLLEKGTAGREQYIERCTGETEIKVMFNIDGTGKWDIKSGISMFDHLLAQLAKHGKFDITLSAKGDDVHHIIEDTAICMAKAFSGALGDKRGIERTASIMMPMDETLVTVALDLSGRGYAVIDLPLAGNDMPGFPGDLARHFLETIAYEARFNLHVITLRGINDHHKVEAAFKGLGRALDIATRLDLRIVDTLPTTKGYMEN